MRNLLVVFLLIPLFCISQNDFRKMNWGDSINDLKEKYGDISFSKEMESDFIVYSHSDYVGGIDATVVYTFTNDKLFGAGYIFSYDSYKDSKERLKDFYSVSQRLNDKYNMDRQDQWLVETWKNKPDYLHFALDMGDVQLVESGKNEGTLIMHTLGMTGGSLTHNLLYSSIETVNSIQEEIDDDF